MTLDPSDTELRAKAEAATPGPWSAAVDPTNGAGWPTLVEDQNGTGLCYDALASHDAEFIAAFDPPTVLALLDSRRALADEVDRLKAALTHGTNEAYEDAAREADERDAAVAERDALAVRLREAEAELDDTDEALHKQNEQTTRFMGRDYRARRDLAAAVARAEAAEVRIRAAEQVAELWLCDHDGFGGVIAALTDRDES